MKYIFLLWSSLAILCCPVDATAQSPITENERADLHRAKRLVGQSVWVSKILSDVVGCEFENWAEFQVQDAQFSPELGISIIAHNAKTKCLATIPFITSAYTRSTPFANSSPEVISAIKAGTPALGMTRRQAKLALGQPRRVNESVTLSGTREQWVYGNLYLYFENDSLISYQRAR